MKKGLVILILLVLTIASVSAQETVDVVYLTDGQIITGKIIETEKYPEHRIKIQTEDGTVYIVKMEDVEKIVEETTQGSTVTVEVVTGDDQPMSRSYFNINLLGFLQWGPIVEYGFSVTTSHPRHRRRLTPITLRPRAGRQTQPISPTAPLPSAPSTRTPTQAIRPTSTGWR